MGGISFSGRTRKRRWRRSRSFRARDAEAFPKYEAWLERLARVVESLLLVTPPALPPKRPGEFVEYLKLLARFRKLAPREMAGLVKIFTAERGGSSRRMVRIAGNQGDAGDRRRDRGERRPAVGGNGLHSDAPLHGRRGRESAVCGDSCEGGMGAVSEAIAASARSRGAEIRTNAPVDRVLVRGGRAYGVVLESGDEIHAGSWRRIWIRKPRF